MRSVIRAEMLDIAVLVAFIIGNGQLRIVNAIVARRGFRFHLAKRVRRASDRATLRQPRGRAAFLLPLRLPQDPSADVILDRAFHVRRQVDAHRGNIDLEHVAVLVVIEHVHRRIAQHRCIFERFHKLDISSQRSRARK